MYRFFFSHAFKLIITCNTCMINLQPTTKFFKIPRIPSLLLQISLHAPILKASNNHLNGVYREQN
jgi:hypothetical protein